MAAVALRERLLAAALAEFVRHGFAGATTRGIARRARTSESSLFRHFSGKDELLQALAGEVWAKLHLKFLRAISPAPELFPALLHNIGEELLRFLFDNSDAATVLFLEDQLKTGHSPEELNCINHIDNLIGMAIMMNTLPNDIPVAATRDAFMGIVKGLTFSRRLATLRGLPEPYSFQEACKALRLFISTTRRIE